VTFFVEKLFQIIQQNSLMSWPACLAFSIPWSTFWPTESRRLRISSPALCTFWPTDSPGMNDLRKVSQNISLKIIPFVPKIHALRFSPVSRALSSPWSTFWPTVSPKATQAAASRQKARSRNFIAQLLIMNFVGIGYFSKNAKEKM
jgi:hypothetical protein